MTVARHRSLVAVIAVVSAVLYCVLVVASRELAQVVGVGYVAVLATVALAWDMTNGQR